jgi:hypothetical protein
VSAKLIFIVAAATAAIGSAVLAGLIVAAAGLCVGMPDETLVTLTTDTAAAVFGGVIALSGIAASLFFKSPDAAARDKPATPPAGQGGEAGSIHAARPHRSVEDAADDRELRAAVEARALALEAARAELHEQARCGKSRQHGRGTKPAQQGKQ